MVAEVPILLLSLGGEPVSLDRYATMQAALASAQESLAENKAEKVRLYLEQALAINPMHSATLRFAAGLYKRQRDWGTALKLLTPLTGLSSDDASLYAELGELNYELKQWEDSERALLRSLSLAPKQPRVLEQLSQAREALGNYRGALESSNRLLEVEPSQVPYWIRKGALHDRLEQPTGAAKAYEKVLQLDSANESVRAHLIEIYATNQAPDKALETLRGAAEVVQKDAPLAVLYARVAEKLKQQQEALNFYRLALKTDLAHEPALFGQARLLAEIGKPEEAQSFLAGAIQKVPGSVRLHLLNIDLLEREGLLAERRAAVEAALTSIPEDLEVLKRAAAVRNEYGNGAGTTYEKLTAALEKAGSPKETITNVLERGVVAALRDGDRDCANRLANSLRMLGQDPFPALRPLISVPPESSEIWVPGGIKALAFAAHMLGDNSAFLFAAEYASTLVRLNQGKNNKGGETFLNELRDYFRTLTALKRLAGPSGNKITILMNVSGKKDFEFTEKVLQLLGWKMKRSSGKAVLEVGTKEKEAERQSFVSTLGIDEIEMKNKLEAGQPFTIEIVDDRVPVIFEESYWFDRILEKPRPPGGLLEAFIDNLSLARLYAGWLP